MEYEFLENEIFNEIEIETKDVEIITTNLIIDEDNNNLDGIYSTITYNFIYINDNDIDNEEDDNNIKEK